MPFKIQKLTQWIESGIVNANVNIDSFLVIDWWLIDFVVFEDLTKIANNHIGLRRMETVELAPSVQLVHATKTTKRKRYRTEIMNWEWKNYEKWLVAPSKHKIAKPSTPNLNIGGCMQIPQKEGRNNHIIFTSTFAFLLKILHDWTFVIKIH